MLSRRDIEKELGKGINIVPLITSNIKENSINLSVGKNAWSISRGKVYWCGENKFTVRKNEHSRREYEILRGQSCIRKVNSENKQKEYMILLPHSTTIVETSEVIGVDNYIGGALHSKVGIVAKGIGHIGTMLGPGYCGHLMVSLHNITNDAVAIEVGSTFVSLSFEYLETPVERTSATVSGHVDKFSDLGIKISSSTREYLTEDWKSNLNDIREKMIESHEYKTYKKHIKKNAWKNLKNIFSKRNIIAIGMTIFVFFSLLALATFMDKNLENPVWVERFWTVGCSGFVGAIITGLHNLIKNN